MKKEYQILKSHEPASLTTTVNQKSQQGWMLVGGVQIGPLETTDGPWVGKPILVATLERTIPER